MNKLREVAMAMVGLTVATQAAADVIPFRAGLPTITAPSPGDYLEIWGPSGLRAIISPSGVGGGGGQSTAINLSGITRDSAGRVTAFTSSGTPYTVTYDAFGPATITGGGKTTTVTRNAQGAVTGISTN